MLYVTDKFYFNFCFNSAQFETPFITAFRRVSRLEHVPIQGSALNLFRGSLLRIRSAAIFDGVKWAFVLMSKSGEYSTTSEPCRRSTSFSTTILPRLNQFRWMCFSQGASSETSFNDTRESQLQLPPQFRWIRSVDWLPMTSLHHLKSFAK